MAEKRTAYIASDAAHSVGATITPDDNNDLTSFTWGIYVGGAGDLKADLVNGGTVTFKAMPIGLYPLRIKRVYATGTTATNLVGLY